MQKTTLPDGTEWKVTMVGHEFRQDDLPSVTAAPDGSIWIAWLSFVGDRDDVVIRQFKDGQWGVMQWVPNTSGDSFLPQVAADAESRVWVVWSQMSQSNWDLYARRYDPARMEWGALERLTTDPLPDINPRIATDGKGKIAVVWQGFRGKHSNIFLKTLERDQWSTEVRLTNHAANDWEPAVAIDRKGDIWVAFDSYRAGNYDVFLTRVSNGKVDLEIPVAQGETFDARPTIAVDANDRVWVAWEQGSPGWGKDQGYVLRQNPKGAPLGGARKPRIRCFDQGRWHELAQPLAEAFGAGNTYQPNVFADGKGSVYVVAKRRLVGPQAVERARGYWEYWVTHWEGKEWSQAFALPYSKGRSSTRMGASLTKDGGLLLVWDTDNRSPSYYHRPVRQQIYSAILPAPKATAQLSWGELPPDRAVTAELGHADEARAVQAIRSYTVNLGGKAHRILRGDFHRHTELSWDGGGANDGSLPDFYRYMIDAASMDFGASTDHQGGAWPYWWWYTQKMTDMYHIPGVYTSIFGYERSAIFPNGHRNIFFAKRSEARVTPFFLRSGVEPWYLGKNPLGDEPGIGTADLVENDTKLLYEDIRGRNGIAISHTSATRMGTDWRDNDPALEPVVEIYQGARTNYEQLGAPHTADPSQDGPHVKQAGYYPQGMVSNAWAKGYKLGIITSSDHGSTHISYAMVYTADASRQGILDAIRKRHTYGAMDNIILDVRMGSHFMGDEFSLDKALPIQVKVKAPRRVVKVDLIKDSQVIYSTAPNQQEVNFEFTDKGEIKGRHYYYVRVEQEDRMLAWSSPFFVNYPKN